jgi:signal transduction histidine kinase
LLYLLLKARAMPAEADTTPVGMRLVLLFVALALLVPLIGFAITRLHGPQIEREAFANLEAIARLKAEQIENWLDERQGDSEVLAGDVNLAELAERFARRGQDAVLAGRIMARLDQLRGSYHYDRIILLDSRSRLLLTSGAELEIAPVLSSLQQQAIADKRVQRRDIYRDREGHIHLDWYVPLVVPDARGGRAVAVVVLRVTAQQFIFPLIQNWPTASASGETMLVHRDRDSVIYLNELRHRQGSALTLEIPASSEQVAALSMGEVASGSMRGTDYRDVPVLAAHLPVAGTDWHLVAKIDRDEVMAPLRNLVMWVSLIAFVAIAAVSAVLLMFWRQQQRAHRVEMREREMAAIERSERHFHSLFENMLEGYAHCRMLYRDGIPEDFVYIEVNPAFETLSGLKDVEGRRAAELVPGMRESNAELFEIYGRVAQSGQPEQFEMYVDMLDRWFEISVYCPEPEHFVAIFDNVTARKQYEVNIRALNEALERRVQERTAQLEATNKELEAFSYSVSHDLRAPLRSIAGFIELLKKHNYDATDDKSKHYMAVIEESAMQMGRLIDDILNFSRIGRAEMVLSQVDLNALLAEVRETLQPLAEGRRVEWKIAALPEVEGERSMLALVLQNLVDNALKFTRTRDAAEIEIGCTDGGEGVWVCYVKDNGVGFDMRHADKLFGLFQRLHPQEQFEGTGVGLANVQRIVQRHGGRVWAESRVGEGATFYFALPKEG